MTRARVLGLVCAVVAVAGCGSTTAAQPKTLSHGRFVYLANHACALETRSNRKLTKPTSFAMALRNFRRESAAYETVMVALRRLTPPRADQAAFNHLLRGLDTTDLTLHQFLDAAEAGHRAGEKVLLKRLRREVRQLNSRAAVLGLRVCAKP